MTLRRSSAIEHLVDLADLGLDCVSGTRVGAMLTLTSLERAVTEQKGIALLQHAARVAGSGLIRNRATVGGSAISCFRWCDLAAPLLAMNAEFHFEDMEGTRSAWAQDVFLTHPKRAIRAGEILTAVSVPDDVTDFAFQKACLTSFSYAIWDIAVVCRGRGQSVRFTVGVSAGTALPRRLQLLEERLDAMGPNLSEEQIRDALREEEARRPIRVTGGSGIPPSYRTRVLPILLHDTLGEMGAQARP